MYLIAKEKRQYLAIPIPEGVSCEFYKVRAGQAELRIVLRVRGRRHLIYSTRPVREKYPRIGIEQFASLCDEIIALTSELITSGEEYIDFLRITGAAESRHRSLWSMKGLIPLILQEDYFGHPVDPQCEQLVTYARATLEDVILMDCEPPIEGEQEELPY